MLETSARLLRLLALLQTGRTWTGPELADRLGVSSRTLRTDVARLRTLGYPVDATPGVAGGYRLGAGATVPPLLLDDDEAVAVVVGLRAAAAGPVLGHEESALRALAKLEQMLPSRLRHRVETLHGATIAVPTGEPRVDAAVLTAVAAAVQARERLRFDYTSHAGAESRRELEPHRLVSYRARWYLVGWDRGRDDWRTFRVDRIAPRTPTGPRFVPHPLPDDAATALVERAAAVAPWRTRARVRLRAPLEAVRPKLPGAVDVWADGPSACIADVGSDNPASLLLYLGLLDVDFEVVEGDELTAHLTTFAERMQRAAGRRAGGRDG